MTDFDFTQPHKIVNGEPILLTADEISAEAAKDAAWEAGKAKCEALAQIAALEASVTPRRLRETFKDPTWMDSLEAQISILREQLK